MADRLDPAEVFGEIYRTDHWQGGSGEGSFAQATVAYRHIVSRLLVSPEIRSVVDVGCGDWQLGSLLDWTGIRYTGVDVVADVVAGNTERFAKPGVRFDRFDAATGALPPADLLLVKDVLQHWPLEDIRRFLERAVPRYPYVLITNDIASLRWPGPVNTEAVMGHWRTVDLEAAPFDLTVRERWDYDVHGEVRGEWTKRVLLLARPQRWAAGRVVPRSVRRIAASIEV